ncbi:MAG: hypothetical protein F7C38_01515 [Desulfurococcales archaeon]|nr:hypothetical protein [Desulfurococcales archaeon]
MPGEKLTTLEDVKKWLVEGVDEPETFVDLRWQVIDERVEDGKLKMLRVSHPKVPVNLLVLDLENPDYKIKTLRIVIETGLDTIDLGPEEKLALYRLLLDISKLPLAKYYIFGEGHEIAIAVDLDKKSLSKAEFEEALASLILGYTYLVSVLPAGLKRKIIEESFVSLANLVAAWYRQGVTRERALQNLVDAGIDREVAEKIIGLVYGSEGGREPGLII